jgi:uncharacterized linocin/CFP29 family protein
VNLGRLEIRQDEAMEGVHWGVRQVLPMVEVRVPFTLKQMELDIIERGAKDADLDAIDAAALHVASFEERVVYHGFEPAGMRGILAASPHEPVALPDKMEGYALAVAQAVERLQLSGICGPYALVLGADRYHKLIQTTCTGFPLSHMIRDIMGGEIVWSPALETGVLLSTRGGDFELTIGQDLSIGYARHNLDEVELYLTESLAFRVVEPKAAIALGQGN